MSTFDELFLQAMNNQEPEQESNNQGDVLKAEIISKGDKAYFLSSGGKSEMILPFSEMVQSERQIGDIVEVVSLGYKDGDLVASEKKAVLRKMQEKIHASVDTNEPIPAIITKLVSKDNQVVGFEVSLSGINAFLPVSHIRSPKNAADLIGAAIDVAVLKAERNRIVVSERLIREQMQKQGFDNFIAKHSVGDTVSAKVNTVEDSFAILTGEQGVSLFLHITEFDWKFVKNLKDVLKTGDQFTVSIQQIDPVKRSIRVSRKETIADPFEIFLTSHKEGNNINATVIRFGKNIAIVESDCGVEIILPVSEMSWTSKVSDPKKFLNIGDRIQIGIKDIQEKQKRVVASLRDLLENPWKNAHSKYSLNSKHEGKVSSITDFGIFVLFDDGLQGLIRIEDIDWHNASPNLKEMYRIGDPVTATVLHVESAKEKLRLGIKQLSDNPFQNFADNHKIGSLVHAKVQNISKDGLDVIVENGLKAFIHISQLSNEHVSDPTTIFNIGDEIKAALRKLNIAQQRIELSIRDAQNSEEKQEMAAFLQSREAEVPTLGSVFGDFLLNKEKASKSKK